MIGMLDSFDTEEDGNRLIEVASYRTRTKPRGSMSGAVRLYSRDCPMPLSYCREAIHGETPPSGCVQTSHQGWYYVESPPTHRKGALDGGTQMSPFQF